MGLASLFGVNDPHIYINAIVYRKGDNATPYIVTKRTRTGFYTIKPYMTMNVRNNLDYPAKKLRPATTDEILRLKDIKAIDVFKKGQRVCFRNVDDLPPSESNLTGAVKDQVFVVDHKTDEKIILKNAVTQSTFPVWIEKAYHLRLATDAEMTKAYQSHQDGRAEASTTNKPEPE